MAAAIDHDSRKTCMYGAQCYRKNPDHLMMFKHPKRKLDEKDTDKEMTSVPKRLCNKKPNSDGTQSGEEDEEDFVVPTGLVDKLFAPVPINPKTSENKDEDDDKDKPYEPQPEVTHEDYPVSESPSDVRLSIEQKFLLEMPDDFFHLWDLCCKLNKEKPEDALIKTGLKLVGPYDVLTGKLKDVKVRKVSSYLCHWRYYYDPPEFMTVIAGSEDEYHIGYYRDDPFLMPSFAASMSNVKPGVLTPLGENIFAAVCSYITQRMKKENPFKKTALQRLHNEIESFALLKKYPLELKTPAMKERNKSVVAKTFHGAGVVVHVDKDNVGYRPLPETYGDLRKILTRVALAKSEEERAKHYDDVHEIITNVQFASDEGDFGMGLELGINLFTFGGEVFHKAVFHLLSVAYELLSREPYIDIIQAHLQNRRKGSHLSILDVLEG